jgi:hypothetical protein
VRTSEWVVIGYLAYLALATWIHPIGARRRLVVTAVAVTDAAGVWWLSHARDGFGLIARDWLPALQILIGYWLSGAFFVRPMPHIEARLAAWDILLFQRLGGASLVRHAPRWLLEYLELAYLTVYVVVPFGFGVVYCFAPERPVDPYWTIVLVSELACYGTLPWVQTRPPRALDQEMAIEWRPAFVRRLNVLVLRRGSVQANTIPSGHAAGACATALAAGTFVPGSFLPLGVLAASITIASVVGRYHYAADAVLGALVAVAAWAAWIVASA